jgi:DNA-binding MurR/RpiR family transcriptional regulator
MNSDQLFKEKNDNLTRSQRRLLEYILSNDQESVFLKIKDLAKRVNVSQATVVRLSRALGFKGFPEFQQEMRLRFRNILLTTSRLQRTVNKARDEGDVLIKVLQTDINNIAETLKLTSIQEFKRFVHKMNSAQRVVIVGIRSAHALAIFLGIALQFLQKDVWVVQPGIGDMWDRLLGLRKNDLIIGISFPRYSRQTVEVLRFAKQRRLKTLAITDSLISPLAQYADNVLTAHYKMDSFIESFTAPLSLINAIVTALGVSRKKRTMRSLKELEGIWENQQIYYHTGK